MEKDAKKAAKKGLSEFKDFISKGNVIDLAVGVIIGGAFGKIVASLVDNILMPLIGTILGGIDFTGLHFKIGSAYIMYGAFIQSVVDFLIIAFCIFMLVKVMNRFMKKEEKKEAPKKSEEVQLLEEIRDLLAKKK